MEADTIVRNCSIATAEGRTDRGMAIAITDGVIAALGRETNETTAKTEIDAEGGIVIPGIIDGHIHNRTPGRGHKEDWYTATCAAAAGGATTVIGMPNTDPPVDSVAALDRKYELGRNNAVVDFQSFAAVTSDNLDELRPLHERGVVGFQTSLAGSTPTDGELVAAMREIAGTGKRLGFHAENGEIVDYNRSEQVRKGNDRPRHYGLARPPIAEVEGIARVLQFARALKCPIHVFQLSTGSGAQRLLAAKRDGVDVTVETTPHYLWFTDRRTEAVGTIAKIAPPLRDRAERDRLFEVGIEGGAIDCVATDHSPHAPTEKRADDPFRNVWDASPGFAGLESAVPVLLSLVAEGRLTFSKWIDLHSTRPAKIWGMYPQKGSLAIGTDADLTVVQPDAPFVFDQDEMHSKHGLSPFHGERFAGSVSTTIVRGEVVYDGDIRGERGYGERVDVTEPSSSR